MGRGFVIWSSSLIRCILSFLIFDLEKKQGDSNFAFWKTQGEVLSPKAKLSPNFACKALPVTLDSRLNDVLITKLANVQKAQLNLRLYHPSKYQNLRLQFSEMLSPHVSMSVKKYFDESGKYF